MTDARVQSKMESNGQQQRSESEMFVRIKEYVEAGDIAQAERLREEMMEQNSLPLTQIIASANLIERAKLTGIDQKHRRLWSELYDPLSSEEKCAFFYSLEEKRYAANSVVLLQGQKNNSLYLIEDGQLDVVYTKGKENTLILQMGPGDFLGEESFFAMSVATSSFVSRSSLRLRVLSRECVKRWEDECPGLYEKLARYCKEKGQYEALFEQKRSEMSRYKRFSVKGRVCAALLGDNLKRSGKKFKATIGDISRGGACFFIKASKKEVVRALLARPLQMLFAIKAQGAMKKIAATGRVVRVTFHLENDYSVHVKFTKKLGRNVLGDSVAE